MFSFNTLVRLVVLVSSFWALGVQAGLFDQPGDHAGPLPVEKAFVLTPELGKPGRIILRWDMPDGYYLYRDRMDIQPSAGTQLLKRNNSSTSTKDDPLYGQVEVFYRNAQVDLWFASEDDQPQEGSFTLTYQGCWEGGICYPPVKETLSLGQLPLQSAVESVQAQESERVEPPPPPVSEQDRFASLLSDGSWGLIIGGFFLAGLALSLTPCVFPMIPIISSIIAGHGSKITAGHGFLLSLVYVLSVALTYTLAGVLAGLFGENLQAALQAPWAIALFSLIFVLLALSMFGFYDLQLPAAWQTRLNQISNHQQGGTLIGVAVMGLLSALIVGPCMAAPLAGALIYIGQSADPVLGGVALFALSLGMGVPILLVGASAGKLLPKAGIWMEAVKAAFGVVLLLMAIWMLDRIIPAHISIALAAAVLLVTAIYMGALEYLPNNASGWQRLWKGLGLLVFIYAAALFVGVLSGSANLLYPLKGVTGTGANAAQAQQQLQFTTVTTIPELEPLLKAAKAAGQPVILDFYADWCVACVELENFTFPDAGVQAALADFARIKVDVTRNNKESKALSRAYKVVGPPALIFYDKTGKLRPEMTLIGVVEPGVFSTHLARVSGL